MKFRAVSTSCVRSTGCGCIFVAAMLCNLCVKRALVMQRLFYCYYSCLYLPNLVSVKTETMSTVQTTVLGPESSDKEACERTVQWSMREGEKDGEREKLTQERRRC